MAKVNLETFVNEKKISSRRKFENKYPAYTKIIIDLLKEAHTKQNEPGAYRYNYLTLAEYCNLHLGFNMVSTEGLRKIIARIAIANNLTL